MLCLQLTLELSHILVPDLHYITLSLEIKTKKANLRLKSKCQN